MLLVTILICCMCVGVSAQRKKVSPKAPAISLGQVYRDIVGTNVNGIEIVGTEGQISSWTFDAAETREIKILSRKSTANNATVTINIITQDIGQNGRGPTSLLRGTLRLNYERAAGSWLLSDIENVDATLKFLNAANISNGGIQPPRSIATPPAITSIVNSSFTVAPGQFKYFPFNVATFSNINGRFRAQGGSGNDIEVIVLDSDALENFRNGHRVGTFYNSGKMTVGTININLNPGSYYLVFNNVYSMLTNKAVEANVSIRSFSYR